MIDGLIWSRGRGSSFFYARVARSEPPWSVWLGMEKGTSGTPSVPMPFGEVRRVLGVRNH
jgi:hypothetical protein